METLIATLVAVVGLVAVGLTAYLTVLIYRDEARPPTPDEKP